MKKIAIIAVVACIAMVVMTAGTASADVQKVPLVPWYYSGPGTGFVIFSNSTNPANNLHITVSLKGANPADLGDVLWVWLRYDDQPVLYPGPYVEIGTLTLDEDGNGNFHLNMSVEPTGTTLWFWLGLGRMEQGFSVFVSEYEPDYPSLYFK